MKYLKFFLGISFVSFLLSCIFTFSLVSFKEVDVTIDLIIGLSFVFWFPLFNLFDDFLRECEKCKCKKFRTEYKNEYYDSFSDFGGVSVKKKVYKEVYCIDCDSLYSREKI